MSFPLNQHWTQIKRVLRYLKGTINHALIYSNGESNSNNAIVGYDDASYAPNSLDRKSISGYIFMFNNGPISWRTKKQAITALSSCEAEYISLTEAAKESEWLRQLHTELHPGYNQPIIIFEDNQSTIKISTNNIFSNRTKHIDVRFHFIRELISNNQIKLIYCSTNDMIADALTKSLQKIKFNHFRKLMNIDAG